MSETTEKRLRLLRKGGKTPFPPTTGCLLRRGGNTSRPAGEAGGPEPTFQRQESRPLHGEAWRRGQGRTARSAPHLCGPHLRRPARTRAVEGRCLFQEGRRAEGDPGGWAARRRRGLLTYTALRTPTPTPAGLPAELRTPRRGRVGWGRRGPPPTWAGSGSGPAGIPDPGGAVAGG